MTEKNTLSDNEKKVLSFLAENSIDCEMCIAFDWISSDTKLSRVEVRDAARSLRKKGYAEYYRGLMNDDGMVAGSGYCITYAGKAFLHPCDKCDDYAEYGWDEDKNGKLAILEKDIARHIQLCEKHYQETKKVSV